MHMNTDTEPVIGCDRTLPFTRTYYALHTAINRNHAPRERPCLKKRIQHPGDVKCVDSGGVCQINVITAVKI